MMLLVGLGNPGKEYQETRHNAGFMALDEFAKVNGFPLFKLSRKHSSLISEGILDSVKVLLVKPQTFMNNSGKAVRILLRNLVSKDLETKFLSKHLIIAHDDIDIPLGKIRVSRGSGSAGHKGVDSIIQSLGTKDFTRIRIGIQPAKGKPENVEDFVLKKFSKKEQGMLAAALEKSCQVITMILAENLEKKYKEVSKQNIAQETTDKKCPECGKPLLIRLGRYGKFYACSGFPECKYTASLQENTINVSCPKCEKGQLTAKRTKKRKIFYGCNRYPECNFALWDKPNGQKCEKCNSMLVEKYSRKDETPQIKCSSKECK
jgi:aminoacyl-tRNA hydrolase